VLQPSLLLVKRQLQQSHRALWFRIVVVIAAVLLKTLIFVVAAYLVVVDML
jgi:hypothetical protein